MVQVQGFDDGKVEPTEQQALDDVITRIDVIGECRGQYNSGQHWQPSGCCLCKRSGLATGQCNLARAGVTEFDDGRSRCGGREG